MPESIQKRFKLLKVLSVSPFNAQD